MPKLWQLVIINNELYWEKKVFQQRIETVVVNRCVNVKQQTLQPVMSELLLTINTSDLTKATRKQIYLSTAACRALIRVCIIWRTPENNNNNNINLSEHCESDWKWLIRLRSAGSLLWWNTKSAIVEEPSSLKITIIYNNTLYSFNTYF